MTTKDKVVGLLKNAEQTESGFISGEEMSRELGVTRMSVNKAIKALRSEGYEIESFNNRGYRIVASPDRLDTAELSCRLPAERMKRVLCYDSISSTNVRLSELAYEGAEDSFTVIANEQTSGRGRRGRSFASPKDKGIYLSYLMRREEAPADVTGITAWTAVAVLRAIEKVLGEDPDTDLHIESEGAGYSCHEPSTREPQKNILGIKWVNDLVMNKKKLCGILTEMSVENETGRIQSLIIGIGVNVNEELSDFDEGIRDIATSLYLETGKRITRAELASEMIRQLDRMNRDFPGKQPEYLKEYQERSLILGKTISVFDARAMDTGGKKSAPIKAEALSINEDFSLRIRDEAGNILNVNSGEVSIRW